MEEEKKEETKEEIEKDIIPVVTTSVNNTEFTESIFSFDKFKSFSKGKKFFVICLFLIASSFLLFSMGFQTGVNMADNVISEYLSNHTCIEKRIESDMAKVYFKNLEDNISWHWKY